MYDLDRTLTEFSSVDYLPNVQCYIEELNRLNVKQVTVTNQGSPACKHAGFKGDYPEVKDVRDRVNWVVGELGLLRAYPLDKEAERRWLD